MASYEWNTDSDVCFPNMTSSFEKPKTNPGRFVYESDLCHAADFVRQPCGQFEPTEACTEDQDLHGITVPKAHRHVDHPLYDLTLFNTARGANIEGD